MSNFFLTLISTYTTPIEEEVKKLEKEWIFKNVVAANSRLFKGGAGEAGWKL